LIAEVFATAITKAEVYYGIETKVHGRKRASLEDFAERCGVVLMNPWKDR